jgi:cyclohexadienyl dehydratase
MVRPGWGTVTVTCALVAELVTALSSPARMATAPPLRVGTSGDYAPFSVVSETAPGGFDGFDVVLARAFAEAEGRPLELVRFRWPELETALREGRFDVAMSGVTVRTERSLIGRFSLPVAESGAVALVRDAKRFPDLASLGRGSPRIVVNAGGHLEHVARAQFPKAQVVALATNDDVRRAILEGRADAAVSDTLEAREWRRSAGELLVLGPFSRDRKAPLLRAELSELGAHLDLWLMAREADGTLAELRKTWLGDPHAEATAAPLAALLAAADERLALMPLVGEAKRRAGLPVADEAQEARVLDAALRAVREAAVQSGRQAPSESSVRSVFQALFATARHLESEISPTPAREPQPNPPSLDGALRPAISRITPKIAETLVRLGPLPSAVPLRAQVRAALRTPQVSDQDAQRLADALAEFLDAGGRGVPDTASTGVADSVPALAGRH